MMWTCPKCQSKVDYRFEVCWACGTSSGGEDDPLFARADDVTSLADAPFDWKHKTCRREGLARPL
jgi:hypothetical protein